MQTKIITTANNKTIEIYDDIFDRAQRTRFYNFILSSKFRPNGMEDNRLEHKGDISMCSIYSIEDLDNMGFFKSPEIQLLKDRLNNWDIAQIRVNLTTLNDRNRFHVDYEDRKLEALTLLYYPNLEWNVEWGGFTMFTNETLTEVEYCSTYTPGRVILFNSTIPHAINPPSNIAPVYRFSFAIQFTKENLNGQY
jgi:Rps23 Pro-64 3,4-dihydroxylase Tpa1-like proline 4-hydroxylase